MQASNREDFSWKESLRPGTIIQIWNEMSVDQQPSTYVILGSRKQETLMDDGYLYECIVMNDLGQVHSYDLHQNEILGIPWYSSRTIKFIG